MIFDNSQTDLFFNFYEDDPLGFLNNRKIDTKEAREKTIALKKKCNEIISVIDRVEKTENKEDLWSKYVRGELPHIHCGPDPFENAFSDALSIQGDRIIDNLEKAFPNLNKEQIKNACFRGDINKEQE